MNWHLMSKMIELFDIGAKYKTSDGVIPDNKDEDLLIYPRKRKFLGHCEKLAIKRLGNCYAWL